MRTLLLVLALSCSCTAAFAAERTANISAPHAPGPLAFAAGEIESELKRAGWNVAETGPAALNILLEAPTGAGKLEAMSESFKIDVSRRGRNHDSANSRL